MDDFKVTHYLPRPAENGAWVPLAFITRRAGQPDGPFFIGVDPIRPLSLDEIQARERSGEIRRLFPGHKIERGQGLWLSTDYDVWLASKADPIGDRHKVKLERGGERDILDPIAVSPIYPNSVSVHDNIFKRLPESKVVQAIQAAGTIPTQEGDYLNSGRNRNDAYSPQWEVGCNGVLGIVQTHLQEISDGKRITPKFRQLQEHSYVHIEHAMKMNKIALLFEIIFDTYERRNSIDIIQLGNAPWLSLVYVKDSGAQRLLQLKPGEQYADTFEEWIKITQDARMNICVPDATAAAHLIWEAVSDRAIDPELTNKEVTHRQLQEWIGSNKDQGIIACDVGVAYRLIAAGRFKGLNLGMSFVPYDQPIPVGIAFSKHDQLWGKFLEEVIREVFNSREEVIAESIADTKERFKELNLEWVYSSADERITKAA